MTTKYASKPDEQPQSGDGKKREAIEADREKPSTDPVDFSEHDNRLGGDPDVPRRTSQSQSQNGRSQKQNAGNADD